MHLFYIPELSKEDSMAVLSKDESKHATKVMRLSEGDQAMLTNGKGLLALGSISMASTKACEFCIEEWLEDDQQRPYQLHMYVAPTKMNDRYEWFLEKATEIGFDSITPILVQHSERKVVKTDRLKRVILSAVKQSFKAVVPEVKELMSFKEALENAKQRGGVQCIAHCEEGVKTALKNVVPKDGQISIFIGPEGDFSQDEIQMAIDQGFKAISLGKSRLRTETAAVAAVHTLNLMHG